MHHRVFYVAILCLGATVGALHALSLSQLSSAVLQILGTIAAGGIGVLANIEKGVATPVKVRQSLPALTAVIFAVLIGYWAGWWATKDRLIASYAMPENMPEMTAKQELDAYRLIGIGRSLGVPRDVIESRIIELANIPISEIPRALDPQLETRIIAQLVLEAGNCEGISPEPYKPYLEDIAQLGDDAEKLIISFSGNNWVQKYLTLRANVLLIPLPADAPGFAPLMRAAGCNHNDRIHRQFVALDQTLLGLVTSIEGEIERLLTSAPEISATSILRDPERDNENFE